MKKHTFYVISAIAVLLTIAAMVHATMPTVTAGAKNAHIAPLYLSANHYVRNIAPLYPTADSKHVYKVRNVNALQTVDDNCRAPFVNDAYLALDQSNHGYGGGVIGVSYAPCTVGDNVPAKHNKSHQTVTDTTNPTNPVVNPPATDKPETPKTDDKHDKKNHCNNGNGNGAEGCNASDKGNQDETPQKGDKAENHPTKEHKPNK